MPHALDCALNAIVPSEFPFLDVEAIVAEIVSIAVLIQVSLKLSASFRAIFIAIMIIWMKIYAWIYEKSTWMIFGVKKN